ncbi:MAG: ATP-binding cassette domain-containing protein [Mycoplasma sp.]
MKNKFWKNLKKESTIVNKDLYKGLEIIRSYKTEKQPLIEVENLKQSFKSLKKEKLIYENLSFNIHNNERVAFLGGNGAGKTITVETICGYRKPASGNIKYNYEYEGSPYEKLSVQFQDLKFPSSLTVKDLIQLVAKITNIKIDEIEEFEKSLEVFELKQNLDVRVNKLSGGQQQRLNVFLSLLNKPKILFLDEFTTGLDIAIKNAIKNFILDYCKKHQITIVLISHDNNIISMMCERIIILANKEIMIDMSKEDVISKFGSVDALLNKYIIC